jgi:hypothetical protein
VVALVVGALVAAGCSGNDERPTGDLQVHWQQVTLPSPPGSPGRIAVRDATSCDGTWYVVGAIVGADGSTRPAAWTSSDGRTWRAVATDPTDFYARRAILYSVACRDGQMAAIGAKSGGAHGNPRTATWRVREDGVLQDVPASFVLYGGAEAVSVNRVAAGPDGWLIAGNRRSGAAVWHSSDATDFRLVDDDPELSSDATRKTVALDPVRDGTGWTLVGRAELPGRVGPVPLAWTSTDGSRWSRQEVPASTDGFADLERVTREGDGLLAVGIRDDRFGTWRRSGGRWRATGSFGSLDARGTGAPFVSGLAIAAGKALVAASDGAVFRLWTETGDHAWRRVATPAQPANTGDDQLTVAADADTVLLLGDDGTSGRVWRADWNSVQP